MLHIFYGPDSFSLGEALASLRRSLDSDGMLSANTAQFDGRTVTPVELMSACDTVPFLAARRLVIVEGLLAAQEAAKRPVRQDRGKRPAGADAGGSPWSALPEYARRLPETTELVLLDAAIKDANPLFTALRPLAEVHAFAAMDRERLQEWIAARVKARKAAIQPRAAAVLAEAVGSNLWQMHNEIDKLALYAYDRPIEVADVRRMVSVTPTGSVFNLTDAIMAGQGSEAIRLVRQLMDSGSAGPQLLALIVRQFRQLVLAQDLVRRQVPRPEIARKLESRSDWVLGKLLDQARRYPAAKLEAGYRRIFEADLNIKRGIQDEETALELLVAELAGLR